MNTRIACSAIRRRSLGRRYAFNRETDRYEERIFEARLQVKPDKMFAFLDTRNGIQLLWSHGAGSARGNGGWCGPGPAIGRIKTMEFVGTKLKGNLFASEDDVLQYVPGGLDMVEAGINRGLSIGVTFLDKPAVTWTLGEGTREKPDLMTYGAVRIYEVSLTPVPRIYTAGIGRRVAGDPPPVEQETTE